MKTAKCSSGTAVDVVSKPFVTRVVCFVFANTHGSTHNEITE